MAGTTGTMEAHGTGARLLSKVNLATRLQVELFSGRPSAGTKLESERRLAFRYGVSRPMIREVLQALQERGLIQIMPGRGAFVRDVQLADAVRPLDMFSHGLTFSSFHQHDKFIEGSYLYNNIEWYVQDNYQMAVALHNPLGPVANAATLHFALSTPNFLIQEDMLGDVPWRWEVVHGSLTRDSGYWLPPRGHGLGVEVDEQAAARHPFKQEVIHSNTVRGNDGAILEW